MTSENGSKLDDFRRVQRIAVEHFDDTLPVEIKQLIARCEANEISFDNDDMSLALVFGEMLWRRLARMADHYNRNLVLGAVARDMRHVLNDTRRDVEGDADASQD